MRDALRARRVSPPFAIEPETGCPSSDTYLLDAKVLIAPVGTEHTHPVEARSWAVADLPG